MIAQKTAEDVARLQAQVQAMLDEYCRSRGAKFRMKIEDFVRQEDWVSFIITPEPITADAYEYARALTDVENQLRKQQGVENVLLVPAMPD